MPRRRVASGYVAFSVSDAERARLNKLAIDHGYAHADPLAAELFRIGLATLESEWLAAPSLEQLIQRRVRTRARLHGPEDGVE